MAADEPGVLADVTRILADLGISIEAIMQLDRAPDSAEVPVVILTQRVREAAMNQAIASLESLPTIRAPLNRIRVETLT
jgi:homoserine dehydrogenase